MGSGLRNTPGAVQVGFNDAIPVLLAGFKELDRVTRDAGVIDQDIQLPPLLLELGEGAGDAVRAGDIQGNGARVTTGGLQCRHLFRELVAAPCGKDHARASGTQHAGEMGAEAAGGASDQCGLTL